MKKQELIDGIIAGKFLALGEYRSGKVDRIDYRDNKTGQAKTFMKITHHVEVGSMPVIFSEKIPDGVSPESIKIPHVKGKMVVCSIQSLSTEKGVTSARGSIEPFDQ